MTKTSIYKDGLREMWNIVSSDSASFSCNWLFKLTSSGNSNQCWELGACQQSCCGGQKTRRSQQVLSLSWCTKPRVHIKVLLHQKPIFQGQSCCVQQGEADPQNRADHRLSDPLPERREAALAEDGRAGGEQGEDHAGRQAQDERKAKIFGHSCRFKAVCTGASTFNCKTCVTLLICS